ncbi:MAG: cytochrome c biogenesis protein ResB [Anaerolineae bacterium]|nr:cytochrome c biogenesis protein ResB [Anaerolineae bacterium]
MKLPIISASAMSGWKNWALIRFLIDVYSLLIPNSKAFVSNLYGQFSYLTMSIWYGLRSVRATGILLLILGVVTGLSLVIPQQANPVTTTAARQAWVSNLPAAVQSWGELLYSLGFARLFDSLWFWLPLGLLTLNSSVALADYGAAAWPRLQARMPNLSQQHPLARRAEQSTRLPESPDTFLDELRALLTTQGFYLYPPLETEPRLVGAARRRWAWLGPAIFYAGLLIGINGLVVSHFFLQSDTLTLWPHEPKSSSLLEGQFELKEVDPSQRIGEVDFTVEGAEPSTLTWRLYLPTFFKNTLFWPRAMEPVLTIEAQDETGVLLRLIPSQENLFPAERLHLPLAEADTPVYFLIPAAGLAFQIVPDSNNLELFEVKVRHGSEPTPAEEIKVQAGKSFTIEGLTVSMSLNSNLLVLGYRDPALPFYGLALGFILVAGVFIFIQPPLQVWIIPEVKGRGGQLYGVVEKFGSASEIPQFLAGQLNKGGDF